MLKMSSTNNNNSSNCTKVASYKLVIDNFSNSQDKTTPTFGFPNGPKFRLLSCSSSSKNLNDSWASIFIQLYSCNEDEIKVKHRMWIVNAEGDKGITQEGISIFETKSYCASYSIPRKILMNPAYGLLVNDTLTVVCEIELLNEDLLAKPSSKKTLQDSFSNYFESQLDSAKHSDVVLVVGEKDFHLHKVILAARSPVFAAMFDHSDTKEAKQGRVEIVDVELEVFELLLRYIYTGQIGSLDRFASELLATAEMYQMDCLKSICERFMCTSPLTADNVTKLFTYADMYRAEKLKRNCIDYIIANSDNVKATEGWKAVAKNADLLSHLFDRSLKLINK